MEIMFFRGMFSRYFGTYSEVHVEECSFSGGQLDSNIRYFQKFVFVFK